MSPGSRAWRRLAATGSALQLQGLAVEFQYFQRVESDTCHAAKALLAPQLGVLMQRKTVRLVVERQPTPGLVEGAQLLDSARLGTSGGLEAEVRGEHVVGHRHLQRVQQLAPQVGARRGAPDVDQVLLLEKAKNARFLGNLLDLLSIE